MHRLKVSLLCLLSITLAGSVFGQTAPQPDAGGTAVYDSSSSGVSSYNSYSGGATYGGNAGAYFNARYFSGNGVGYTQGYQQYGGFVPFWMSDDVVIGPDMRLLIANTGGVGGNFGGIGRKYFAGADRILGAAGYFDVDQSANRNTYTQGTFGLETLGQYWDLRGNVYYTGNTQDKFVGNGAALCVSGSPYFSGNNIVFQGQQGQYREQAMGGADIEVGAPIFQSTPWLRGYVGAYYYKANQVQPPMSVNIQNQTNANPVGFRGHLDAWIADDLLVGVNVTTDPVWGTNVNGMVDFRFSGFKPTRYFPQWTTRERMLAPWQRNWRIAVEQYQTATNTDVVAINPVTGKPYFVSFVNGDNTSAGTGTFEDPFKSFNHPNGIPGADIIYVARDGSSAANPYIGTMKLLDNQILLGEGGTMTPIALTASYGQCSVNGNFTLPGVDGSGNYPWVSSPGGHAIGLANNNEVSGFHIINSVDGILGNNITDANLRNLDIHNNSGRGINLTNVGGTVSYLDVNSSNNATGIFMSETGKTLTSTFTGVTTNNNAGNGLQVVGTGGSVTLTATDPTKPLVASGNGTDNANVNMTGGLFQGDFTGAKFTNSVGGSGFAYSQAGGAGNLNLTNSLLNNNGIDGLNLAASAAGSISANVTDSQLNSNVRDGIHSVATGGSTIITNVDPTAINQNGRDGYFYDLSGNSVLNATFLNDSLVSNTRSAIFGLMNASTANVNMTNVLATNSGQNGFALDATAGSIFNATTNNVDFSNSGANGMSTTLHALSSANFNMTGTTDNSNIQNGVSFLADNSTYTMTALASTFNNNSMNGLVGTAQAASTAVLDFSNTSSFSGNAQNGVFVTTTGLSNVNASFANTAIDNNSTGSGVRLSMDNSPNSTLAMSGTTTLNNNGANGLQVDATTNTMFTPTLVGTTIQGNGQNGVLLNASSGSKIGTIGTPGAITNSIIQNNGANGLETNATGASSLINLLVNSSDINNTTGTQKIGFQFDATAGGQVITSFINGSTLNNNTQNAVNGNVSGAGSLATITLDGTNASNSGSTNALLGADTGGVLNFNASNGASFDNSVTGAGLMVNVAGINSVANVELDGITANGNKTVGFGATATDVAAPGVGQQGATLNVCLQTSSFSNNTLQGLAVNVAGPGAVAYYGVGTTTAGTGVTVNGNGQQGLLTQTIAGGELDYRSVNSTYNNNGTGATKYDGVDMRVDGAGSKLRTLFSGGTANGNGRDGLHFGGLTDGGSTNGADITVSLSNGTTASGNGRYSLNFDANGANTANLVEDPSNPPILVGPINLDFSNAGTAVVNLTGVYHFDNNASNGLAVNFANTTTAFFSLDGQGVSTADNNALDGISVDMTNVTNGSIFIGGFSSISGNGGNGIHVGMTNVTNGALGLQGIAGGTTMTGNGGNGIDVQLNTVNLVNNFSTTVVSPNVIGLTLTDNQSYNACLPLPVVLPVNSGVIVPTTGLTIDSFKVANSGAGGIIVDGTAATIATGGAITNNTVSGSLGGDGIQLSLHNAALVNPTADGFVLTGNSSTGNTGNGINIDLLNATMNNLNMSGTTTVNNNTSDGLHINLVNSSMTPTTDLDSLLASGNGGNGVSISAATNSNIFIDIVSLTANNNGAAGFAGSALSGSTLNVCLDAGSVSTNGTQGLNLNVNGAGSVGNFNLGPVATLLGTGVTVNGNTDQGLLATVQNGGVLNYRSINSTYNNNGTTTANDGVDMRVDGTGSTIDTLFYGGSANGNGRDGYHFGGLTDLASTNGATLTVSLSGVTSSGNTRDALNFDALNAANANLLMDPANPSTIVGNSNVNVNGASNEVVLKLSGLSFAQGFSQTFDHAATGINNAYVSLDGLGTSTISNGATTDAFSVTMKGLVNGSVLLDNYASITNTSAGRDAIAVTMDGSTSVAGFMNGAVEIKGPAGLTAVSTNGGNGVDVKLTNTNLVNGLGGPSSPIPPIVGLTTTSNLASPLNCLPLPTTISLNGLVPATGLTISNLNVTGTAGVNGIVVTGTDSTIAATGGAGTGGTITNNTIGGAFTGDGINVTMTNTGATAAMINGLSVTGNTVSGTIGGDGIRVQDLNTGAAGSAADNITIGSNTVTGVTGNGIEFVVTNPTASVNSVDNLQIINNTVKTSGNDALLVNLTNATSTLFDTSGNSLDTSVANGFALNLSNATLTSWTSTGGDITGNGQNGLVVTNSNTSSILSGLFTNWAINSNGADGVKLTTSDATQSIFGDLVNTKSITFTGGSISNNGTAASGNGVNLTNVVNGSVANLAFTNETIGNTAIGGTQQNGLIYTVGDGATAGTVKATFTGGTINNNANDGIVGTILGNATAGAAQSTITLNGTTADSNGARGADFTVNNAGLLNLIVQANSAITNSGADGIRVTATGLNTVGNVSVLDSSVSNNGRTTAGNGVTLNLDDSANSLLTVTNATIGNTAVGGTQDNGIQLNLNQTLLGAGNANAVANITNSTLSNNSVSALDAEIIGASTTPNNPTPNDPNLPPGAPTLAAASTLKGAHITLNHVTAAGSGANGMLFNVNGSTIATGGVLEVNSTNGTSITGSGLNGILVNANDATTLVALGLTDTAVTGNGTTAVGDGLQANVALGARFNLATTTTGAAPMAFSSNSGNGINIQTTDVNTRSDLDLYKTTVDSNTLNGLNFLANNGAAVNVRAYDTNFDTNKLAGLTGAVTQTVAGVTPTSGIVNIIGGEANGNGSAVPNNVLGSGYSLTATNTTGTQAILTGQFQPDQTSTAVSATSNQGYGINFVANGIGTEGNLLMTGNSILSGNTKGTVNVNMSNMDQAVVKLSGTFDNSVSGDGIDVTLTNISQLGVVAVTGGEVNNNAGYGMNIKLDNVQTGGVLIGGLTSVSGNGTANGAGGLGQDGIFVSMNNVGNTGGVGALTIDGKLGNAANVMNVSNNTGNGVNVQITGGSNIDNAAYNALPPGSSTATVIEYNPLAPIGTPPNPFSTLPASLQSPLLLVGPTNISNLGVNFTDQTAIQNLTMASNGIATAGDLTGNAIKFVVNNGTVNGSGLTVPTINHNTITNTGVGSSTTTHDGINIQLLTTADVAAFDVSNNSINATNGNGLDVIVNGSNTVTPATATLASLNIANNTITNSTGTIGVSGNGIDLQLQNAPWLGAITVDKNTITGNKGDGFQMVNPNTGYTGLTKNADLSVTFTRNTITGNGSQVPSSATSTYPPGGMGIDIVLNNLNATKTTVNVYGETDLGNTISNNASFGLFLQATNQALYNLNVTSDPAAGGPTIKNVFDSNTDAGIAVVAGSFVDASNNLDPTKFSVGNILIDDVTVSNTKLGSHPGLPNYPFKGDGIGILTQQYAEVASFVVGSQTLRNTTLTANAGDGLRLSAIENSKFREQTNNPDGTPLAVITTLGQATAQLQNIDATNNGANGIDIIRKDNALLSWDDPTAPGHGAAVLFNAANPYSWSAITGPVSTTFGPGYVYANSGSFIHLNSVIATGNGGNGLNTAYSNSQFPMTRIDIVDVNPQARNAATGDYVGNSRFDNNNQGMQFTGTADAILLVNVQDTSMSKNKGDGVLVQNFNRSTFGDTLPSLGDPTSSLAISSTFNGVTVNQNGAANSNASANGIEVQVNGGTDPNNVSSASAVAISMTGSGTNVRNLFDSNGGADFKLDTERFSSTNINLDAIDMRDTHFVQLGSDGINIVDNGNSKATFNLKNARIGYPTASSTQTGLSGNGISATTNSNSNLTLNIGDQSITNPDPANAPNVSLYGNKLDGILIQNNGFSTFNGFTYDTSSRFNANRGYSAQMTAGGQAQTNDYNHTIVGSDFSDNGHEGIAVIANSGVESGSNFRGVNQFTDINNGGNPNPINVSPIYDTNQFLNSNHVVTSNFTLLGSTVSNNGTATPYNASPSNANGLEIDVSTNSRIYADIRYNTFHGNSLDDVATASFTATTGGFNANGTINTAGALLTPASTRNAVGTNIDRVFWEDTAQLAVRFIGNNGDQVHFSSQNSNNPLMGANGAFTTDQGGAKTIINTALFQVDEFNQTTIQSAASGSSFQGNNVFTVDNSLVDPIGIAGATPPTTPVYPGGSVDYVNYYVNNNATAFTPVRIDNLTSGLSSTVSTYDGSGGFTTAASINAAVGNTIRLHLLDTNTFNQFGVPQDIQSAIINNFSSHAGGTDNTTGNTINGRGATYFNFPPAATVFP